MKENGKVKIPIYYGITKKELNNISTDRRTITYAGSNPSKSRWGPPRDGELPRTVLIDAFGKDELHKTTTSNRSKFGYFS